MNSLEPKPAIQKWFFIPPAVGLILLSLVNLSGHDVQIFEWLNRQGQFGSDAFWITVTTFGDGLVLFILTLLFIRRKPALAWSLIVSWLLIALWIKGIKAEVVTYRPPAVLAPDQFRLVGAAFKYNSFPSGHATSIAAFIATLCLFFRRRAVRLALISIALLVAYSRIAIGVHWTTDVLAGLLAGWLSALIGFALSTRFRFGTSRVAQIVFAVVTIGAGVRMLFVNHTDYPQAHFLLQTIAFVALIYAAFDYLLARRKRRETAEPQRTNPPRLPEIATESAGTNSPATSLDPQTS